MVRARCNLPAGPLGFLCFCAMFCPPQLLGSRNRRAGLRRETPPPSAASRTGSHGGTYATPELQRCNRFAYAFKLLGQLLFGLPQSSNKIVECHSRLRFVSVKFLQYCKAGRDAHADEKKIEKLLRQTEDDAV